MSDSDAVKEHRMSTAVDQEMADAIWEIVAEQDRSISWVIRKLVEVGLEYYDGD